MDISKLSENKSVAQLLGKKELFHAYIVSGGDEESRRALADMIAAAAVCSDPDDKPCGRCIHCAKASQKIHPDIMYVSREKDKRELYVDQMRAVRADSVTVPNDAEKKVYIINEADMMNAAAQNAMLKILEEPPHYAVFILLAENTKRLLSTVRSRCVELALSPEKEPIDEKTADEAKRLFDIILSKDDMALTEFVFENEQMNKEDMRALSLAMRCMAVEKVKNDSTVKKDELLHIADVFFRAQRYLDANVSVGHVMSLVLSEFVCSTEMRK